MKNFGLSEKEIKQIINNVHPEGWNKSTKNGRTVLEPSQEQLDAVRLHLEKIYAIDKRREYLKNLVERLRQEVENRGRAVSTAEPA